MREIFDVSITVILERSIEIKADDKNEAEEKATDMILLYPIDENDYSVDFTINACEN